MNVGYAIATSSGTAALHLSLLALDIGQADEVIIPSYVCTALLNAVRYVGATPVLADLNPGSYHIDPNDVKKRVTPRTKAIIVPHLFGRVADLKDLLKLNLPIIEDCAQSVGASFNRQLCGSFGHMAIFSFYATKVLTCGEGGMVVSNYKEFADTISDLKSYDQKGADKIRFSYKMTDFQAALGLTQLARLNSFLERRRMIAQEYRKAFENLNLKLPPDDPGHIYYRFVIEMNQEATDWIQKILEKGLGAARPVYLPLHRHLNRSGYAVTETAWRQSISIPIYPSLTSQEVGRVIETLTDLFNESGL
jgi:perosamine synthetase